MIQTNKIADHPAALWDVATVSAMVGLKRTSLYVKSKAGEFPKPIRLGSRCTRWRAGDVLEWLQAQGGTHA